ncbi:MAG: YhcH/YjgK/YiaL family protein [Corynebacterium sp.]|uniref:YhcH/YjgK/YiaL family protein n=1 Tax=Corynebacterium sp. TaxID=1720 RepID=UPI0026DEB88B|nr:YhcH/YjgK/YiaL family protein [Corynebacterium sp.]MDO5670094.1 YhcH/YjgK/YiaL family protein [Corynebacterium sp.]
MIIDTLDQRHKYAHDPVLSAALTALAAFDATTPVGTRVDLDDEQGHITVAAFESQDPASKTQYEAHRRYADVHVVLAGEERIDVASLTALTKATPFDEAADIGFHEGPATVSITLKPSWFVVCYPTDAHRPGVWATGPGTVLKAVGKLRVA